MTEMDSAAQFGPTDRIAIITTSIGADGETHVKEDTLMRLPQREAVFTGVEPSGLLAKGLSMVDTSGLNQQTEEDPGHVLVDGERVGGKPRKIAIIEGVGSQTIAEGPEGIVEVVVFAHSLTARLARSSGRSEGQGHVPNLTARLRDRVNPSLRRRGW